MCSTELCVHRDLTASCSVWNGPHFWHSATCTEQSNKTPECSPWRWFRILVMLLFLLLNYQIFGDEKECVCVCARVSFLFFFPECIWANQKIRLLSIATLKWLFWAAIWKIALDILCCPGKTCNRLQRGCASSDREAFHPHSHKPLQFFVSLDCIAHCGQEQSCAFFLIFLLNLTRECQSQKHVQNYLKIINI